MSDTTIFIVAGESSGDALGAGLMAALARQHQVRFVGVGGAAMEAQGLRSLFPMHEIALMGIRQIAPRLLPIFYRLYQLARTAKKTAPQAIVLIDSPEFNHRLATRIRRRLPRTPILVYAAPTVWGWRASRAKAMAKWCARVLAVLPFEPRVMQNLKGPPCEYVGHPILYTSFAAGASVTAGSGKESVTNAGEEWRARHKLNTAPVLALLPGSRRNEVKSLLPRFLKTAQLVQKQIPELRLAVLVAPPVRAQVEAHLHRANLAPILEHTDKHGAMQGSTIALAAGGTAVLELALAGTPTAAAYTADPVLAWFIQRMMRAPSSLLPNLILDAPVLAEFLGPRARPELMAEELLSLLQDEAKRTRLRAELARLRQLMQIKEPFPQARAAELVWQAAQN